MPSLRWAAATVLIRLAGLCEGLGLWSTPVRGRSTVGTVMSRRKTRGLHSAGTGPAVAGSVQFLQQRQDLVAGGGRFGASGQFGAIADQGQGAQPVSEAGPAELALPGGRLLGLAHQRRYDLDHHGRRRRRATRE
ncbi:hypothetical protein [Streptomyces griseosporeus]|uniref:hypothetical protein n=1 Tax=Streptomyces griseosporeus TaxID=1910 RepID=UPI003686060B